ncbi:Pheromone-regulated membrane protein 10 [Microdochium nivale]|nr:Pheromone-regulated membrane protein 10 [Microdochium nivale]
MSAPNELRDDLQLQETPGGSGSTSKEHSAEREHGGPVSPGTEGPVSSNTERVARPRVRFNSSAAQNPLPASAKPHERLAESPSPKLPRPALSRNPASYNSMVSPGPDVPMSPEKARSAEDAARRARHAAHAAGQLGEDSEKPLTEGSELMGSTFGDSDHEDPVDAQDDQTRARTAAEAAAFIMGAHTHHAPLPDTTQSHGAPQVGSAAGHETDGRVPNPRGGVFYQILQSYRPPMYEPSYSASSGTRIGTAESSGATTPTRRKWYKEKSNRSQETLSMLVGASRKLANPAEPAGSLPTPDTLRKRPEHKRRTSGRIISAADVQRDDEHRIQMQIADILQRQRYLTKMCRALMLFGAPGHRLEEHMKTTAMWLEVDSQFLYVPDCMIISFDDNLTHTTKVKIVREAQGTNLSKLKDTHEIYKEVLHDVIPLNEALERLEELIASPVRWPDWVRIIAYGLASACISVFFNARFIDMPVIAVLGTLLGFGQVWVVPRSRTFAVVFEVFASTVLSFAARGFGSINGGQVFCFSALTQSSIAMILPGVLVLNSALELQSKAIVPGSIRMVYAIIYSLFLGYGITVGTTLYGYVDPNATSDPTCHNPANRYWGFLFVPLFILFATVTSNAKLKQMPLMVLVGTVGYVVNFYTSVKFAASLPIAYTLGAFTVGVLANAYSRFAHGVAITVLLPAVFVQVPGSLATSGAITAGLQTATALNSSDTGGTHDSQLNTIVFSLAASMIQISIGLSVGLSVANLVLYPMGKRRSALWSL